MGKLTGLVMIVAGLGTAAYVYPMIGDGADKAEKQLTDLVAITTPGAAPGAKRVETPVVAGPTKTEPPRVIAAPLADATRPGLAQLPAPQTAPAPAVQPAAPAIVATVPAPVPAAKPIDIAKPLEAPVPQPAKRASKADDERAVLARSIQAELKRVGCYQGDADGTWNAATRSAMKTFIDRVNATLPTDEPDHILKTLVQGHPGNACGKAPASSVVAQAPIQAPAPVPAKPPTEVAAASPPTPAPVSQPAPRAAQPSQPAAQPAQPATSSWETTTTPIAPAMAAIAAAAAVSSSEQKRPSDLPGRMAVGATEVKAPPAPPVAAQTQAQQPEPPQTRFVVQPKERVKSPKEEADRTAEKAEKAAAEKEKAEKAEREREKAEKERNRPSVGAVAAAESSRRVASPPPSPQPQQRVAAYRPPPPPPRYVGASVPSPAPVARPRFGPQIFRQLELSGR